MKCLILLPLAATLVTAQTPQPPRKLTLAEAEAIAARVHPRILGARLNAQAETERITQAKSAMAAVVSVNLTGAVAQNDTTIGAGAIQTQGLSSRTAAGLSVNQNLYDFGRTKALTSAAESRATAVSENANAIRQEIILRVDEAYYRALLAEAQLRVVKQALEARRTERRQIEALTRSELRSTLDLSFSELMVAQAELDLNRAENDSAAAMIALSAALGGTRNESFTLEDVSDPPALPENPDPLVTDALGSRPDLAALRHQVIAARRFAESERLQSMPALSAIGVAGAYGFKDAQLHRTYGAAGLNLAIPVLNGGLFSSRRREADLRVEAAEQEVRDLEIRIGRDIRSAWVDVSNAQKRLAVTANVVAQANRTMRLAQARFNLGLSTIVELNSAALSQTNAEVSAAVARYDYLLKRAFLSFVANTKL
jgi:outer membrane protein